MVRRFRLRHSVTSAAISRNPAGFEINRNRTVITIFLRGTLDFIFSRHCYTYTIGFDNFIVTYRIPPLFFLRSFSPTRKITWTNLFLWKHFDAPWTIALLRTSKMSDCVLNVLSFELQMIGIVCKTRECPLKIHAKSFQGIVLVFC